MVVREGTGVPDPKGSERVDVKRLVVHKGIHQSKVAVRRIRHALRIVLQDEHMSPVHCEGTGLHVGVHEIAGAVAHPRRLAALAKARIDLHKGLTAQAAQCLGLRPAEALAAFHGEDDRTVDVLEERRIAGGPLVGAVWCLRG